MTSPLSQCTCACELTSGLSLHQQPVFHRSVTEAHEIRAVSTQNNHAELRDNPEPKHQKKWGGHCFIYHPTRMHPREKHGDEMHRYCPTSLAQRKTGCDEFLRPRLLLKPANNAGIYTCLREKSPLLNLWLHLEADKCVKRSLHATLSMRWPSQWSSEWPSGFRACSAWLKKKLCSFEQWAIMQHSQFRWLVSYAATALHVIHYKGFNSKVWVSVPCNRVVWDT